MQSTWKPDLPSHVKRKVQVGSSGEFSQQSYSSDSLIHQLINLGVFFEGDVLGRYFNLSMILCRV